MIEKIKCTQIKVVFFYWQMHVKLGYMCLRWMYNFRGLAGLRLISAVHSMAAERKSFRHTPVSSTIAQPYLELS